MTDAPGAPDERPGGLTDPDPAPATAAPRKRRRLLRPLYGWLVVGAVVAALAVARWAGLGAAVYVALYGVAGALIGTAAAAVLPNLSVPEEAFAAMAQMHVPAGLGGVVLAAGVAAMMSTASGATIAAATVARVDVVPTLRGMFGAPADDVARASPGDW